MTERTCKAWMVGLLLLTLLAGCNMPTAPQSTALAGEVGVWFDKPLDGSVYALGPVEIVFHAAEMSGTAGYQVWVNDTLIAEENAELAQETLLTIRFMWEPDAPGMYDIRARAFSNTGVTQESAVTVGVVAPATQAPVPTETPMPIETVTPTPSPTPQPTATLEGTLFGLPAVSAEVFYYRFSDCPGRSPNQVTIEVEVTDPRGISQVEIYFRIQKYANGEITDWIVQEMTLVGGNLYRTTIDADQLPPTGAGAELQYRIYATNAYGTVTNGPLYTNVRVLGCGS